MTIRRFHSDGKQFEGLSRENSGATSYFVLGPSVGGDYVSVELQSVAEAHVVALRVLSILLAVEGAVAEVGVEAGDGQVV
ncbi:hypothetical protein OG308_12870 [Nocardia salmonicida]|uniref:Uncharacterized protein n=1 Tax=Nocardia salmonicida TaxID=53431 RepID=A0ABZ1NJM0_9NOCA